MSEDKLIEITAKALDQIRVIISAEKNAPSSGVRLGVVGGGCSGLSYKIEMGEEKEKDNIILFEDVRVFVDLKSSIYLKGIQLDFKDGLNGKGFVFNNPNASNTCGCGESFSV